jgi:DNA-binding NarL/FixJ family response regulator
LTATLDDLTPRQRQIVALVARGRNDREIAAKLGISDGAVKSHVCLARGRIGLGEGGSPRVMLAIWYWRQLEANRGKGGG